jgi:hypothetical protein
MCHRKFGIIYRQGAAVRHLVPSNKAFTLGPCCLSHAVHIQFVCQSARRKIGGRPAGVAAERPLTMHQSAYKPGSGWHAGFYTRLRDGHSSWTPVARRLQQPTRTAGSGHRSRSQRGSAPSLFGLAPGGVCRAAGVAAGAVRSYRTVSPLLHPLPLPRPQAEEGKAGGQRSVFCGTFPRLAPAGRYPAPLVHGARTFLPGFPERPSGRLTRQGWGPRRAPSRGEPFECLRSRRDVARPAALGEQIVQGPTRRGIGQAVDPLRPEVTLEGRHHVVRLGVVGAG